MKTTKITYWISTSLVSLMMLFSAYSYIANPMVKEGFHHLGFPDYFRVELAIAKILGALLLLATLRTRFKEWVYAGFTIVFISAFVSHVASGDGASHFIMPLLFLIPLAVSYFAYHKMHPESRAVTA